MMPIQSQLEPQRIAPKTAAGPPAAVRPQAAYADCERVCSSAPTETVYRLCMASCTTS